MRVPARRAIARSLLPVTILIAKSIGAETPKALQPPPGQTLLLRLHGKGNQIYTCQNASGAYSWKLKAPDAKLFNENGTPAGRHFAGPTWETKDGSRITGKLAASVPSADSTSIPWLLLTSTSHQGTGILAGTQSIQRLNTKGGLAPASGCDAASENKEAPVAYEADYSFYGAPVQK